MNNKNKIKNFTKFALLSFILTIIFITPISVNADNTASSSLKGDFISKVFDIEPENGASLFDTQENIEWREKINNEIYNGTANKSYSLYDRFGGGNLKFIPYYGEQRIETDLLDRFYSQAKDAANDLLDGKEFTLTAEDIKNILVGKSSVSNNNVYDGRVDVLSKDQIDAGYRDTRVAAYNNAFFTGGDAAIGNFLLSISNAVATFAGWVSGPNWFKKLNEIWNNVCDLGLTKVAENMVTPFMILAICCFVISLVFMSFKVVNGKLSIRILVINTLSAILSISIVLSLTSNPKVFSDSFTKIVSSIDEVFDKAIQMTGGDVVASSSTKYVREAFIWEKVVFDPWCYGMFQDEYENLYTTYDDEHKGNQMKQSHDDVDNAWDSDIFKHNSAKITGDINVPLGNDKNVKNWAALAWSCQSIYHIDAVSNSQSDETSNIVENNQNKNGEDTWPKATTAPMNNKIYVDNFRWIDAKLDISPQYSAPDDAVLDYDKSKPYEQTFIRAGLQSIWMVILLIPIVVLVFKKLTKSFTIVTTSFRLIYRSLMNLVMPERYNLLTNLKVVGKSFYDYIWWSSVSFLSVIMYTKLAGTNIMHNIIWIIIGIMLCKARPIRTPAQITKFGRNVKRSSIQYAKKGIRTARNGIEKGIRKVGEKMNE